MDNGICNGSQGIVSNIIETEQGPIPEVTFVNGIKKQISMQYRQSEDYPSIAVGQIPLTLALALTIHKIQGATLNMAAIMDAYTITDRGTWLSFNNKQEHLIINQFSTYLETHLISGNLQLKDFNNPKYLLNLKGGIDLAILKKVAQNKDLDLEGFANFNLSSNISSNNNNTII